MPTTRKRGKVTLRKSLRKPKNAVIMTPEGVALLDEIAFKYDLSKSELIEYLARGSLAILNPGAELTIKLGNGSQPQQKETVALESYELLKKHLRKKDKQVKDLQNSQAKEMLSKEALQKQIEEKDRQIKGLPIYQLDNKNQDNSTRENIEEKRLEKKVDSLQQEVDHKQEKIEKLQNEVHRLKSETEQLTDREQDWLIIIPLFLILTISFALFLSHYYPNAI